MDYYLFHTIYSVAYSLYSLSVVMSMDNYIEVFLTFEEFYSTFFQQVYKHIVLKLASSQAFRTIIFNTN